MYLTHIFKKMHKPVHKLQSTALSDVNSLKTLVENRTVHTLDKCELNLFETYEQSNLVPLKFNDLVVTSMLRGKKVMHLYEDPEFDYFPGQTVIIPSQVEMKIDFPEASFENPTQCLALAIDHQKIQDTLVFLNERYPKEENSQYWNLNHSDYFFFNNEAMATTINKLIGICMSSNIAKDVLADITLQELLVHIIQLQTLNSLDENTAGNHTSLLKHIVQFIRSNLNEKITLQDLVNEACMSKTSFYRYFKREVGISPNDFIIQERIKKAKILLKDTSIQVNQVGYESGFDDSNYFIRAFKKQEGLTPKQFRSCFFD